MKYLTKIALVLTIVLISNNISGQGWTVNPPDYSFNGQVTVVVFHGASEVTTGTVGAFVGGICRGYVDGTFFPPSGKTVFTVICYSNLSPGETLTFKYYDPSDGTYYDIKETLVFVADMIIGGADVPLQYHTMPLLYSVTGGGSYCQGGSGSLVGLSGSEAGVTYTLYKNSVAQLPTVAGTGSAISFGNQLAGTYTVSGNNSGGTVNMTGNAVNTENPNATITLTSGSSTQTVCINTVITNIVFTVAGGGTGAGVTGLPAGVSGVYNTGVFTISGTPTESGTFNYTVTTTGTCTQASAVGTIEVKSIPLAPTVGTITQPTCALATGSVALSGLPSTGTWTLTRTPGGVTTTGTGLTTNISGLATGTYSYTVTNADGCISAASSNVVINTPPVTPTAPVVGIITQPTCSLATGSVTLSGLPSSGSWTLTRNPGSVTTTGTGTSTTLSGIASGTYTYTVTNTDGCTSVASSNVIINTQPVTPTAPVVGTITQPTCALATGSVALSGLPSTGTWTLTRSPGGVTTTGTGLTTNISGLATGTYTYTVTNADGCISAASSNVVINAQPVSPTAPVVGTITQPTCALATGSVVLSGLPSSGSWTLTRSPGGTTTTGTGTSTTVTGIPAGTYTYTVTNSVGCPSTASGNVLINTQPATPTAPVVGVITQPTCTVSTGSVVLSGLPASGTWTLTRTPGGTITTGTGTSTTVSPIPDGNTYTYTVTNSDGCISSSSANVVINTQPVTPSAPLVGTITLPTCSLATGSVVLSGLPSSGTWTITRYPGAITSTGTGTSTTISGLPAAGTYNYTVTNASSCISTLSANVDIPAQPVTPTAPVVGTITQPTCALATGSVSLSGLPSSGSWTITRSPGGTTTTGSGTSTTISGIPAGTYTFTVTNSDVCTSPASSNVVINTQPVTPTAPVVGTITQPTCALATGSVVLSGLPATGTWTLTRTPGGVTTTGTGTGTTVTGIPEGSYTYTVTNASTCTSLPSANVVINAQPSSPAAPLQSIDCSLGFGNASITVTSPTGTGLEYRLDAGTFQGATTFTGVANGNHTITVRNASGCTTTGSSFNVNCGCVNPPAVTLSSNSGSTCGIAPVTVSGNTFGGSATSVTITENGAGTINPVSASSSPFSFTYTPAAGDAGNTVTITVTTNNPLGVPCAASSATYALTVNPTPSAPSVGTITQPTCALATGSVVLSGLPSTGTWTLTRTPGAVTSSGTGISTTVSGLASGTYSYTVASAAGCISASSANIVINAQPVTPTAPVVGVITQPTCTVSTGSVVLSGLPASGTWTLTRTPGGTITTGTGTSTTVSPIPDGNTYTYTVTNSDGCISSSSANVVIITQPVTPSAPLVGTITPPTCSLATGSVVLSGLPSSGTWTLTRYPGAITSTGTGTSTTISGLPAAGTYNYTVTNASSCISTLSANVYIPAQPVTPAAPVAGTITQPTCALATGSVTLSGLPSSGSWILTRNPGGATTTDIGTSTTISGLAAGTYTFTVTNSDGCTSASSSNVTINSQPVTPTAPVVGTITQPTCALATGSVVLSGLPATGSWTLTRTPGGTTTGTGTSTTLSGIASGTYSYTVTNSVGCISASSSNVVINTPPVTPTAPVVGIITQPTCALATGSVTLSGLPSSGSWTLTRNPGSVTTTGTGTSTTLSGIASGTYTYTVTNTDGCTSVASSNVIINTQPVTPTAPVVGTITQPTCALATGSVALSGLPSTGTWTLTRSPGGVTTTGTGLTTNISGLATGTYTYTVTNADGCISAASSNVVINAQPVSPTAPVVGTITQPTCALATGSVVLSGLPSSGSWTLTRSPGGTTTTGTGTSTTVTGIPAGTYTYTVTNSAGCPSTASGNVLINTQPATPTAPVVGVITQPTCTVSTGSVVLSGLPASGTWTLTRTPGGTITTGTGTSTTVSPIPDGNTYTYTVTNSDGCISSSSANVVINTQPVTPSAPLVGTITPPTCSLATGSVVLSGLPSSGTWTLTRYPGAITSTGTGTNTTISGLPAAGTYNYTVTNASSCISTLSANVDIPAQPVTPTAPVVGTITQPTCALATGSVSLSGLPSSGSWTITRSPGGTTTTGSGTSTTISGIPAGTYTFTVTNSDVCTSPASSNVVINTQPVTPTAPVVGTITQPTCALATGSVALSGLPATGTWTLTRTPGGVTTTGTGTGTTVTGIPEGSYTYTVTNASTCTSLPSANVVINAQPSSPAAPLQSIDCSLGFGNASITVTSPTGTGLEYRLDAGTFQGATTFTGVANGNHTITVRNASGCTTTGSSFNVNCGCVNPPAVTLSSNSGSTCGIAPVTVSGNTFGGSATSVTITENGAGTINPVSASSSPFSFTYTPAAGDAGNTVTITVTTNNPLGVPCAASSATYALTVNPTPSAPSVGTITQPTCALATGSVVLSGLPSTGTWTLTRTPGAVTSSGTGISTTVSGLPSGTYTFTVTSAAGCISGSSASVTISAQPASPSAPVVGTITQPTCALATGSVILSGLPSTGTWTLTRTPGNITVTGTGTSRTITGMAAGTYTYTVTNSAGCISSSSDNILINTQPVTPSAPSVGTITQPTCAVATGSVILLGLPSTGTWTITQNPGGSITTGSGTSTTISSLPTGTNSFTVMNDDGCTSVSSANVVINTQPVTPLSPTIGTITQPTCTVSTGSVVLSGLPSTGTWILTRSPGGVTTTGTGTTKTITSLPSGTYSYTVTNSVTCISVPSADIVINPQPETPAAPVLDTIYQPTCTVGTGSVVFSGLPETGLWTITRYSGGVTTTGSGATGTVPGISPGTYNFTVKNAANCTSPATANIIITTQPVTPVTPTVGSITQPTCTITTGSVILNGLPASGTWTLTSNPEGVTKTGTGTSTTVSGLLPGTYSFFVTNLAGCTSSASSNAVINPQPATTPSLLITNPSPVCYPSTADLTTASVTTGSTPDLTYSYWTDAGATIHIEDSTKAPEGTYYIKGTSTIGCFTIKPVTVTSYLPPTADAGPDTILQYLFTTTLRANVPAVNETGTWSVFSGSGNFLDPNQPGTTVSNLRLKENILLWTVSNGVCPDALDYKVITVEDLKIPTLITPNMDGKNDYFELRGIETLGKTELVIFDRRGVQVYKNSSYDNLWNGVDYNDNPLPDDTYFFTIRTESGLSKSGYIVIRR